jgi:phosphoglycerate dehydrogenase-like enzyme
MTELVVLDDWNGHFAGSAQLDRLRPLANVTIHADRAPSRQALLERLAGAAIVITNRERTALDAELFAALPDLRLVAQTGDGTPNIDLAAATAHGVQVANTPGGSTSSVVELVVGMLIALARGFSAQERALRAGAWPTNDGLGLEGKAVGVVGFGRLGRAVTRAVLPFGVRVLAWSPSLTPELAGESGAEYRPFDGLLRESDVVTLHVRLNAGSRGLIGARELAQMRPSALLINTSRGPIVDEGALIGALRSRRIAGAALDVYDEEPLPAEHPLRRCETALLTAHCGGRTDTSYANFVRGCVDNVVSFLEQGRAVHLVNRDVTAAN